MQQEFIWTSKAEEVILTGNFDNWSKSMVLEKDQDGVFRAKLENPKSLDKVIFKFVVDGEWLVSPDYASETDESGNTNNVFVFPAADAMASMDEASGMIENVTTEPLVRIPTIVISDVTGKTTEHVDALEVKREAMLATVGSEMTLAESVTTENVGKTIKKKKSIWESMKKVFSKKPKATAAN